MTNTKLTIHYSNIEDVVFENASGMQKYLESEANAWSAFLDEVTRNNVFSGMEFNHQNSNLAQITTVFERLNTTVEDTKSFNKVTGSHSGNLCPPPQSVLTGQLILGLFNNSHFEQAVTVYIWFINENTALKTRNVPRTEKLIRQGADLISAAYAIEVLPEPNVSAKKIEGYVREAKAHSASLKTDASKAAKHNENMSSIVEELIAQTNKSLVSLNDNYIKQEASRAENHQNWTQGIEEKIIAQISNGESRLATVEEGSSKSLAEQLAKFKKLENLYYTQLRLRAPVELWGKRQIIHTEAAKGAMVRYSLAILVAILVAVLVPIFFGDYIAGSFFDRHCELWKLARCERVFSIKGPLTVAGLLIVMSLILWVIRLQFRMYLSERHLALDASERMAFAETFLAMREGDGVSSDSETIVLASMFRPTQDGIIKDDETGIDLSAASIIAKQLGRGS